MRAPILLLAALTLAACDPDLDIENPNAPTEEEVLADADGVLALAVGMQAQYSSSIEDFVVPPALITDEWGTDTRSLLSYRSMLTGPAEAIDRDFGIVEAPWANAYEVVRSANALLEGAETVGLGPATTSGVLALARLFKAMALGTVILQYERVPIDITPDAPELASREAVLDEVISLLEAARADLAGVSDADLSSFRRRALGDGFALRNTLDAMLARYHLIAGEYQAAIDAADRVDPGVLSIFNYQAPDENPIHNLSFDLVYVAPLASWARRAEAGDQRVTFWADTSNVRGGNPADTLLVALDQYDTPTDAYPVYLPDEMKLIKAEASTRMGDFATARQLINEVRTQQASPVEEPVANLPALPAAALDTEAELIAQIAYERAYELFLQGLRWEDVRRLGADVTTAPTAMWLPIPLQECRTNPSANC